MLVKNLHKVYVKYNTKKNLVIRLKKIVEKYNIFL